MSEALVLDKRVCCCVQGSCPHPSSPSLPGVKNADRKELTRVASMPNDAFFFYVGDFKLLGTLVPLMTRRVCTSIGGTLRTLGMDSCPSPWVHL